MGSVLRSVRLMYPPRPFCYCLFYILLYAQHPDNEPMKTVQRIKVGETASVMEDIWCFTESGILKIVLRNPSEASRNFITMTGDAHHVIPHVV